MPYEPFRKLMTPDFQSPLQADAPPQMEWMPWEEGGEAANAGNIADKLKTFKKPAGGGGAGSAIGGAASGLKLGGAGASSL